MANKVLHVAHPVEAGFPAARKMIRRSFKNFQEAKIALGDEIGRTRLYQIFSSATSDDQFTPRMQRRVIAIANRGEYIRPEAVYGWLSRRMSHEPSELERRLLGEYKYWRSFKHDEHSSIFQLRVGRLRISERGGLLFYQHRSANASQNVEWEDDGFAFVNGNRLYCLGFREKNMRLLICHIPDDLVTQWFHGVVLSVQNHTHRIFSAAFVMFHQKNREHYETTEDNLDLVTFKRMSAAEPNMQYKIIID